MNVSLHVDGEETSAVAFVGLAVGTNKELLKVPGDIAPVDGTPHDKLWVSHESHGIIRGEWEFFLQIDKQGVGILSIYVHLLKKLELWFETTSRTDILERIKDFIILAVLLLWKKKSIN